MTGYNAMNDYVIDFLEIGICPTCCRRLTAECQHGGYDLEREFWHAAHIVAEQMGASSITDQEAFSLREALIAAHEAQDVRTGAERAQVIRFRRPATAPAQRYGNTIRLYRSK